MSLLYYLLQMALFTLEVILNTGCVQIGACMYKNAKGCRQLVRALQGFCISSRLD